MLSNNTLERGNFPVINGQSPNDAIYDGRTGQVFIAETGSSCVVVLSDATNTPGVSIPVGSGPMALTLDSGTGQIFVPNSQSNNVSVISDTTDRVVATIPVGTGPSAAAYDEGRGEVFVSNSGSGTVGVISDATDRLVANISLGSSSYPSAVVYDAGKGEVFVSHTASRLTSSNVSIISDATNSVVASVLLTLPYAEAGALAYDAGKGEVFAERNGLANVSVISDTTDTLVATIGVGSFPDGVTYDPAKGEVFVANAGSGNLTVISDATNRTVANIDGISPGGPFGTYEMAYDSAKGEIFVPGLDTDLVSIVSDTTDALVAAVPLGYIPTEMAYDNASGELFVTNPLADNLLGISDGTNQLETAVPAGSGTSGVAYDAAKGQLFVVNNGSGNVTVISAATHRSVANISYKAGGAGQAGVPCFDLCSGLAYDPGRGEVFVVDTFGNEVTVLSDTTDSVIATIGVGYFPVGIAYDPALGEMFVSNWESDNVTVISDSTNSVVANVAVGGGPTGVAYDSGRGEVFVANEYSSNLSVISATTNTVVGWAPTGTTPRGLAYDPVNGDVFVSNYDSNNVSIVSDSNNSVVSSVAVGAGPMSAAFDPQAGVVYVADSLGGALSIICPGTGCQVLAISTFRAYPATVTLGAPIEVTVTAHGGAPGALSYRYSGLPPGCAAQDSASLTCTPTSAGVYLLQVVVTDGGGNQSSAATILTVLPMSYLLTFTESGLPAGTPWEVIVNGVAGSSVTASLTLQEPNGSYSYVVAGVAGFSESPGAGTVTVNGSNRDVPILFGMGIPPDYTIGFVASGLPAGATWSVSLGGTTKVLTGPAIAFTEPNGTYAFVVGTGQGFRAIPSTGSVVVAGADLMIPIGFEGVTTPTFGVTFVGYGSIPSVGASIALAGTVRDMESGRAVFVEPNGTYPFTVAVPAGYSVDPATGTVVVDGSNWSLSLVFGPSAATIGPMSGGLFGLAGGSGYELLAAILGAVALAVGGGFALGRRRSSASADHHEKSV